ncbi:hypothetical protein N9L47_09035 [Rhodobacteraceae bacterium]|nr:hypothetical protein [Paracoccaceae bacterium]
MILRLSCLACLASPAAAWEASRSGPVCLLSHGTETGQVVVSHDPRKPLPYAIQIRRLGDPWIDSDIFAMRFDGPNNLTISTDRHQLTDNNAELTVTDSGFDNVLRGIEASQIALAILGEQALAFPLDSAAPQVAKFRACATGAGV